MATNRVERERLNLSLPKELVDALRREVPARERTRFVARAITREIRGLRLRAAIEAAAGVWRDEDHQELATPADIDRWIEAGRAGLKWDRGLPEEDAGDA